MTASSSVVRETPHDRLTAALDAVIASDWNASVTVKSADLRAVLTTPQPAEQDAREAVAWRVKDYADGWILFHHEAPARKSAEARNGALVQPLYAALAQAAPDGWRLVPVEPTEAMIEAGRVVGSLRFANRASDTYRAMLSASPAPPAQGEGS